MGLKGTQLDELTAGADSLNAFGMRMAGLVDGIAGGASQRLGISAPSAEDRHDFGQILTSAAPRRNTPGLG